MRPRTYDSYADQKYDQRIGFIAFPIVNILIWVVITLLSQQISRFDLSSSASGLRLAVTYMPWIVNGALLLWAFIFRQQIGVGYLVSFAGFAAAGIGLGLIGMVALFVSTPLLALTGLIGVVIFLGLLLVGGIWFLVKMLGLLRRWWAI